MFPTATSVTSGVVRFRIATANFIVSHGASIALSLFVIVGGVVLDDYGLTGDEWVQREIAKSAAHYILGNDYPPPNYHDRFYGVAFELPLLFVEQVLGLEDSRSILLSRHLLTHLFFLAGGFFCYLLVCRMFNSRLLALFALLLFLLHPRIYAHSFFNSKDLPFLSMFMIVLFFSHRAFRKDTVWAFLLCGAAIGILINIRVLGVMLFAAVLCMRALDLFFATEQEQRKHVLLTAGGFALSGGLVLYVTWPLLWPNPLRFFEALTVMSSHPHTSNVLFQGTDYHGTELPPHYIPTWISISTPPVALILGIVGIVWALCSGVTRSREVLRNTELRFALLLIACLILPILAVIALKANIYDDWRQLYFLYAPLCLLAVFGLHWLVSTLRRAHLWIGAYALVAFGLVLTVVEMVQIHPNQAVYFNSLVDRSTPEYLRSQYEFDYWRTTNLQALQFLLDTYPSIPLQINVHFGMARSTLLLPSEDRQRIHMASSPDAIKALQIFPQPYWRNTLPNGEFPGFHIKTVDNDGYSFSPVIYRLRVYNNTVITITTDAPTSMNEPDIDMYAEAYRSVVSKEPIISSDFDLYLDDRTLAYVKEPCGAKDTKAQFFLNVFPADPADVPERFRKFGFDILTFDFAQYGVRFDGKCLALRELPEYHISSITTGQWYPGQPHLWKIEIPFPE